MERDYEAAGQPDARKISIHALRMERDLKSGCHESQALKEFQSTRSVWSATNTYSNFLEAMDISIHALRMERDPPMYCP